MLTRIRFRSAFQWNLLRTKTFVLVSLLIGIGAVFPRSQQADDSRPSRNRTPERPNYYDDDDDDDPPKRSPEPKRSVKQKRATKPVDDDVFSDVKPKPTRTVKQAKSADPFDDDPVSREEQPNAARSVGQARLTEPADDDLDEPEETTQRVRPIRHLRAAQQANNVTDDPDETSPEVVGNGRGMIGRASHLAGKTFGRNDSITPFEAMPYILTDEHFIFADVRGFVTNRSQAGGNFGLGYRRLFDDWNAWGGASVWYDADQSTSKLFQQVGLSFEGLIQKFEMRSNVYLPFTSSQTLSNSIGNASIVGNQLLFGRSSDVGTALRGVDFEVGYSQPILDRHVLRGFIGGYHFDGGSTGGVNGFKARIEGVINNTVTAQVLYTHDKLYGDNAMVGVSLQFPFAKNFPTSGWTRNTPSPFRFVERNYNVIVANNQTTSGDEVATDPTTGKAYIIDQIYAPPPGGTPGPSGTADGTSAHPFSSVAAAQTSGGNVFLVQEGSVLNEAITLTSGQHLFGQGNFNESLATVGGGNVQIPNLVLAAQQSNSAPIIQNVAGTAVTLASNSEVAGFTISGPTGNGISGNSVSGVSLHDLIFNGIGGDAINLSNSSGNVTMSNLQVNSAVGNGIVFNGGNANISYLGTGSTITAQGNGFVLDNLTGGTVGISGLSLSNVGGTGLLMNNVATNVNVDSLSVSNSGGATPGSAVAISGLTGTTVVQNGVTTNLYNTYNFSGKTTIDSPKGTGFAVSGSDANINVANLSLSSSSADPAISVVNASNPVTFGNLVVNTQNATGLFANTAENVQVNNGSITTVNAPAVDITSSGVHTNFGFISVNGGPYGIKLQDSTGNFTVQGNGAFGTGGTIQNTTVAGVMVNGFGSTNLNWMDFTANATAIQSTGSTQLGLANMKITGSTGYAVDSLNDSSVSIINSIFTANGAVGGGTIRVQANTAGSFASIIRSNDITDPNGTAIQFLTQAGAAGATQNLQISSNLINAYGNGGAGISANWNGPVLATISGNTVNAYGTNMTAIFLQDPTLTSPLTASIGSNTITFEKTTTTAATSGTSIWIIDGQSGQTSTGNSTLTLSANYTTFQASGGTGLRYGLYAASSDTISQNTVIDTGGGATGMLFDYVGTNSVMLVTGNSIELLLGDKSANHGFVFSQVGTNVELNTPSGSTTNLVFYPSSPSAVFSAPATGIVGGIIVDNVVYK